MRFDDGFLCRRKENTSGKRERMANEAFEKQTNDLDDILERRGQRSRIQLNTATLYASNENAVDAAVLLLDKD